MDTDYVDALQGEVANARGAWELATLHRQHRETVLRQRMPVPPAGWTLIEEAELYDTDRAWHAARIAELDAETEYRNLRAEWRTR